MIQRVVVMGLATVLGAAACWANPAPWERTETRAPCTSFSTLRAPYFGETHVHTEFSFDAVSGGINHGPRDAYRFAAGQSLALPAGTGSRTVQLQRPLDFAAVTDHSEFFGEVQVCLVPGLPGYDSTDCQTFRAAIPQTDQQSSPGVQLFGIRLTSLTPSRFPFCSGGDCAIQASLVWQDMQAAAEEFYDRSADCSFTSFVGYEYTGNPNVQNIHRNVIFRNESVPALPISYFEEPTPQGLWAQLRSQCTDAGSGCDVLAIPHNSNLSNGIMFLPENADSSPLTAGDAAERAAMEPLVEVYQHKGDSECHPLLSPGDEQCGFEKWTSDRIGVPPGIFGPFIPEGGSFVRNTLMEGIAQEEQLGVNPFRFGLIGATDSHNATPGLVDERDYGGAGHLGLRDSTPELQLVPLGFGVVGGVEASGGGLAVMWAEENSRDALFAAMRRREVYATSGTRPIVRFFGGRIPSNVCRQGTVAQTGYESGVPMGGEIGPVAQRPRFVVQATRDPGAPGFPGTPLQRVQIVKGWIDAGGAHEKVFDIAGSALNGAVDDTTCLTSGSGADELCEVWTDPEFDRDQRAFYYARVLENPICRWSTLLCNANGVDCSAPGSIPPGFEECCDPARPRTVQERAWTSPIWYRPEGVARLRGKVSFGAGSGNDVLRLKARLGAAAPSFDVTINDLTVRVTDDDLIYEVTIPAGTLQPRGNRFVYSDPNGGLNGLKAATVTFTKRGEVRLSLRTVPLDLSNADRSDHMVHVTISIGDYEATHNRLWIATGQRFVASRT